MHAPAPRCRSSRSRNSETALVAARFRMNTSIPAELRAGQIRFCLGNAAQLGFLLEPSGRLLLVLANRSCRVVSEKTSQNGPILCFAAVGRDSCTQPEGTFRKRGCGDSVRPVLSVATRYLLCRTCCRSGSGCTWRRAQLAITFSTKNLLPALTPESRLVTIAFRHSNRSAPRL
jgi:hypothetical protein